MASLVFHAICMFALFELKAGNVRYGISSVGKAYAEVSLVDASSPSAESPIETPESSPPYVSEPDTVKEGVSLSKKRVEARPQSTPLSANAAPTREHVVTNSRSDLGGLAPVSVPQNDDADFSARLRAAYLSNPPPPYPSLSRRLGEQGKVLLSVNVGASGEVSDLDIKTSSGYERLDEAALRAVRHWIFLPAKIAGVPVAARVDVPIRFELRVSSSR